MKQRSNPVSLGLESVAVRREQIKHGASRNVIKLCQSLIATTLEVEPESICIKRCVLSPSKLFLKTYGHRHGMQFFAKIYLVNQYPTGPRLDMPWRDAASRIPSARSIEEQIDTEWNTTQVFRELAGNAGVARPMGKSLPARTIVWEEAPGYRVDDLIQKTRWEDPKGRSLAPALFKTGAWLAKVHQASVQEHRSLDVRDVGLTIRQWVETHGLLGSKYGTTALKIVADSIQAIGRDPLEIPEVLTHGDFCTANLIWDRQEQLLTVVDFEHSGYRLSSEDVISLLFSLRVHLLNPWIPRAAVTTLEESFWWGYGAVPRPLFIFVNAIASAMVFYYYLPRVATRGKRRGWWAGMEASIYQALFESRMVTKRLGIPREWWEAPRFPAFGLNGGNT